MFLKNLTSIGRGHAFGNIATTIGKEGRQAGGQANQPFLGIGGANHA